MPATPQRDPGSWAKRSLGLARRSSRRLLRRSLWNTLRTGDFRRLAPSPPLGSPAEKHWYGSGQIGLPSNPGPTDTAAGRGEEEPGTRARTAEVGRGGWIGPTLRRRHPPPAPLQKHFLLTPSNSGFRNSAPADCGPRPETLSPDGCGWGPKCQAKIGGALRPCQTPVIQKIFFSLPGSRRLFHFHFFKGAAR